MLTIVDKKGEGGSEKSPNFGLRNKCEHHPNYRFRFFIIYIYIMVSGSKINEALYIKRNEESGQKI